MKLRGSEPRNHFTKGHRMSSIPQVTTKNKIFAHPDRDIIIKMIGDGKSDREVEQFLKNKYPAAHHEHLRCTSRTVYNFRQEFMSNGKLSKVAIAESNVPQWAKRNREITAELSKNSAYQEAIAKIAEEELNTKKELIQVMVLLKKRMEVYYNSLSASDKPDEKSERILLEQMKLLLGILQQSEKASAAATADTNISVNVSIVKDHASVIRDAIRDTLSEVDPILSIEFMERVNMKMKDLEMSEETGLIPIGS